jgi:ribose transport system ATP-binding protein
MGNAMAIEMVGITMEFPGTRALSDVSISFREGEVHGLIGENGAGKSTLLAIMSGVLAPTSGELRVDGRPVRFRGSADAIAAGIALVSQEGSLVPMLTGADNIMLGSEPRRAGIIGRRQLLADAEALARRWFPNTTLDLRRPTAELPYADQKVVEILRALRSAARILILDEPTASLPAREKEELWALIQHLVAQNIGIVLVSHILSEIHAMSKRISVLRNGHLVGTLERDEVDEAGLISKMLGHARNALLARDGEVAKPPTGVPTIEVSGWGGAGFAIEHFALYRGEIVGLIGLTRAGHAEFARSLYEPNLRLRGTLKLKGEAVQPRSSGQARRLGISMVPDQRMVNSLVGSWTVRENLALAHARAGTLGRLPIVMPGRETRLASAAMARLGVKAYSPEQPIEELSGGNKQKVSIGKWLYGADKAVPYAVTIFVEPTEGVDVGAKAEIHRLVRGLAASGVGVIIVSSDLLEIQVLADRVIPFFKGAAAGTIPCQSFSEQTFVTAMAGQ